MDRGASEKLGSGHPTGAAVEAVEAAPEEVVARFRRHGWRLIFPVLVLVAVAGAAGFWVGALPERWQNLSAAAAAVVIGVLFGVSPILTWLSRRTTITTRRVIDRAGVARDLRREIPFSSVREVRSSRTLLQRMRGTANIEILFGNDVLELIDVPGARTMIELCQELMQRNFVQAANGYSGTQMFGASAAGSPASWE